MTPKDNSSAYSQIFPTPVNLKEDILVELALLHRIDIITTLPFSKYTSPIIEQTKTQWETRTSSRPEKKTISSQIIMLI